MSVLRSILVLNQQKLRSILPTPILSTQLKLVPDTIIQQCKSNNYSRYYKLHQCYRFYSSVTPNYLQAENSSSSSSSQRLPFSSETLLITESGKARLRQILDSNDGAYLRISVEGGGCSGFQYKFKIENKKLEEDDIILNESDSESQESSNVVIDKTSLDILKGSTIDYEKELIRSAFRIINIPLAEQGCSCGASFNVKID